MANDEDPYHIMSIQVAGYRKHPKAIMIAT